MIEELTGLQEGIVGFKLTGHVSGDDYDEVLTPAI
jgi:hypothetical protein